MNVRDEIVARAEALDAEFGGGEGYWATRLMLALLGHFSEELCTAVGKGRPIVGERLIHAALGAEAVRHAGVSGAPAEGDGALDTRGNCGEVLP